MNTKVTWGWFYAVHCIIQRFNSRFDITQNFTLTTSVYNSNSMFDIQKDYLQITNYKLSKSNDSNNNY